MSKDSYTTGYTILDDKLGNLTKGSVYVVNAPTGMGKSCTLYNLTLNLSNQCASVLFLSVEDSLATVYSVLAKMQPDLKYLGDTKIQELPLGSTINDIDRLLGQLVNNGGIPDVIVLDYISLLSVSDNQIKADLIVEFVNLSKKWNFVGITAASLHRNVIGDGPVEVNKLQLPLCKNIIAKLKPMCGTAEFNVVYSDGSIGATIHYGYNVNTRRIGVF